MRIVIFIFVIMFAGLGTAFAKNSSFHRSCDRINLHTEDYNVWIQADCGDGNGGFNYSEIALTGVHNFHGKLVFNNKGTSSFQRSCRNAYLEWEHGWVRLVATCGDGKGGERTSGVFINNIHNQNGWLIKGR